MVRKLQFVAVDISKYVTKHNISLFPVWIPRESKIKADVLSKSPYRDSDDWQISFDMFNYLNMLWGVCTIDRFASCTNTKCARFNSKIWMTGTENVDSMTIDWSGEMNWIVPPPTLIPAVIGKMVKEKAKGILIVPVWKAAAFWPLVVSNHFVSRTFIFQKCDHVRSGLGSNGIFTNDRFAFQMLACLFGDIDN